MYTILLTGNVKNKFIFKYNRFYNVAEYNHSNTEYGYGELFGYFNSGTKQQGWGWWYLRWFNNEGVGLFFWKRQKVLVMMTFLFETVELWL